MYNLESNRLLLTQDGQTEYIIVIAQQSTASVRHAAEELALFLTEITTAVFPVCTDEIAVREKEIVVGWNRHTQQFAVPQDSMAQGDNVSLEDIVSLGDEGFLLKTFGQALAIIGSEVRGALYGVYTFLEEYCGCRWFTPTFSHIPKKKDLVLKQIEDRQVPVLENRDPYHCNYFVADWHARNKCNGNQPPLTEKHGGKMEYCKYFVHSFDNLVPVEEFFDTHPEYFSEVGGVRLREKTQLCLTNPEVLDICVSRIMQWIAENPTAKIVTVSVNDCFNPCQCEKCRTIYEREESHAGVLLEFINKVAEIITAIYPHVLIDTLSYLYTRKAPKTLKAHPNVIVRVCTIECCFAHPFSDCKAMGAFNLEESARPNFAQDLINWSRVCERMYIWDYITNFENYLQPFPNFKVLQPNIQFFIENGVKGIFLEGYTINGNNRSGELDEMRMYVLSKLLWNPHYDVDRAVNEFMTAYYASAAPAMREYYDLLHAQVENPDWHVGVYDPPTKPYLNQAMLQKANEIFDWAECLADDETILQRVKIARLSITHTILAKMPIDVPERNQMVEELFQEIERYNILFVTEHYPLEVSKKRMLAGEIHLHNQ